MNKIKRLFVIPFLLAIVLSFLHASYSLIYFSSSVAWWSVIISCGSMLGFFAYLGSGVSHTNRSPPILLLAFSMAAVMAIVDFEAVPSFYTLVFGCCGSLLYIFWYSGLGRRASDLLGVGKDLPDFEFQNQRRELINSHQFLGKPTIYLFYRGSWCPLCVAQIKEISEQYQRLNKMGVETVLISPKGADDTEALAEKFSVPFIFGYDQGNKVARQLGIAHEDGLLLGIKSEAGHDTVFPTVVITDASGRIIWTHQTDNYRVRPEPETFIAILERHLSET